MMIEQDRTECIKNRRSPTRLMPPDGLIEKWRFYTCRYGFSHASIRFLGSRFPWVWRVFGPIVSRAYRETWRAHTENKIVNLGGGGNCLTECLTCDIDPRADTYVSMTKRLPFDDQELNGVFLEESIEHVNKNDAIKMIEECFRVLKPSGVIRLSTPSLDQTARSLLLGNVSCDYINTLFYDHGHRYLYTVNELCTLFVKIGFVNIRLSTFQDPNSILGRLDSHADRFGQNTEMSIYLDAQKPDAYRRMY